MSATGASTEAAAPTPSQRVAQGGGILYDPAVPLEALIPDPRNPNQMPEAAYRQLVANVRNPGIGFTQPMLLRPDVDEHGAETGRYFIVDGHHRAMAAKECGMTAVPAMLKAGLTRTGAQLLGIAMNNIRGVLDLAAVGEVFKDLHMSGVQVTDMVVTGFDEATIGKVLEFKPMDPDSPTGPTTETPNADAKIHTLEIVFADEKAMKRAKRRIDATAKKLGISDKGLALMHLLSLE